MLIMNRRKKSWLHLRCPHLWQHSEAGPNYFKKRMQDKIDYASPVAVMGPS